jgi:hypothetical protein
MLFLLAGSFSPLIVSCLIFIWYIYLFYILGLWLNALGCSFLVSMASLICLIILPVIFGKQIVCRYISYNTKFSSLNVKCLPEVEYFWIIWAIHLFQFKGNHQRLLLIHWLYLGSGFFKLLSLASLSYSFFRYNNITLSYDCSFFTNRHHYTIRLCLSP